MKYIGTVLRCGFDPALDRVLSGKAVDGRA